MNSRQWLAAVGLIALGSSGMAQNLAVVNGKSIPKARAEALIKTLEGQGQKRSPEMEQMVREELINREILMQEAEKRGVLNSEDVRTQLEMTRQSVVIRAMFADYAKKNPVTPAEIQAEYDKFKSAAGDKEYRARHILVDTEAEANTLLTQIKGGAKFEDVAKKSSKDPGSGANGGDLDWAPPAAYVAEFSGALVKLAKGQTTEKPVKSQFGYHIIRLDDTRVAAVPAIEELKPQIEQQLAQRRVQDFQKGLREKAKIQ